MVSGLPMRRQPLSGSEIAPKMPKHSKRLSCDGKRFRRIVDLADVAFVRLSNEILEMLDFDRSHFVQDARDAVQSASVR
jgi:hypothetical protein